MHISLTEIRKKMLLGAASALVFLGVATNSSHATTQTGTLDITAQVEDSCRLRIENPNSIPYSMDINATGIAVLFTICSLGTDYIISAGAGSYGTIADRQMKHSSQSDLLSFNIYLDQSYSNVWGNQAGSQIVGAGTGSEESQTVYIRIPSDQGVTPGAYSTVIPVELEITS